MKRLVCAVHLVILSLALFACSKGEATEDGSAKAAVELVEPVSVSVVTIPVSYGYIQNVRIYEAYIVPYTEELAFERSGTFSAFYVGIGDKVKKGDVLAELSEETFLETIDQLEEKLVNLIDKYETENERLQIEIEMKELAIDELKKQLQASDHQDDKKLEGDIIASEADITLTMENIRQNNELKELEAYRISKELDEVRSQINHHQIIAPFDGEIVAIASIREGDSVALNRHIIGIAKPDETRVTCEYISETDIDSCVSYSMYLDGKEYPITYLPYDEKEYASIILKDQTPVSTFLYEGNDPEIRQGDFAIICLVEDYRENVLTVPIDALHSDATGDYVYVSDQDRKVKRNVITGLKDTMSVEITDGLREGENVYVEN